MKDARPPQILAHALFGPDWYIEDLQEVHAALRRLHDAGWRIVRTQREDEDPPGGDWELIIEEWTP